MYQELQEFRNEGSKKQAIQLSADWGVLQQVQQKTKKYFEELCEDERLFDGEARFQINIFYKSCCDQNFPSTPTQRIDQNDRSRTVQLSCKTCSYLC